MWDLLYENNLTTVSSPDLAFVQDMVEKVFNKQNQAYNFPLLLTDILGANLGHTEKMYINKVMTKNNSQFLWFYCTDLTDSVVAICHQVVCREDFQLADHL